MRPRDKERDDLRRAAYLKTPDSFKIPVYEYSFTNQYADVYLLLQEKLLNFIRLNSRLRQNIMSRRRFLVVTEEAISINLYEFKEGYRNRFIEGDFEAYCINFIELLKPVLLEFMQEVTFTGYIFQFKVSLNGKKYEKIHAMLVPADPPLSE